jgi:multiple sugar transport system substrate-binding protein
MPTLRSRPPAHRHWLLAIVCGFGVVLTLTGCKPDAASMPGQRSEVSFMVFGDPGELKAYQAIVDTFEARNPDVDVELIHIPSQSDYRQRLGTDFAAGTAADVVLLNYRRFAPFAAREALVPLGPYMAASQVVSSTAFYVEALSAFLWNQNVWCLPQNLSSLVVYYNRDLFAAAGVPEPAAGWTWDDFLAAAKALTRDTDGDGTIDQYGLGTEVSFLRLAPFIWQNGGDFVDDPYLPSFLTLNMPAAQEAFQWFVDLQTKHHVVPDAAAEEAEDSESRFLNGRNAMHLQSRRIVPTLRESAAFDWNVAPLPQNKAAATVLHSDGYCMSAVTKNKDAAWRLIEFANSPEGQALVATTGRTVPSIRSVAESAAFLDPTSRPASSAVWLDVLPVLRTMPVTTTWIDVETIVDSELERAYYGQATVDEATQAAMTRVQEYLEE